jgi:DNA-binding beta-propeller fold protein YncE
MPALRARTADPRRPMPSLRLGLLVVAVLLAGGLVFAWTAVGPSGRPLPLQTLQDVPLVGGTGRLDYESLDDDADRLYIAHLGSDSVIVFDTKHDRVVTTIPGTASVRGVLAVPDLQRVYAAAQGTQDIVVIDEHSNSIIARIKVGDVDGLAYDPKSRQLFVSDESGARDAVIDTTTNRLVATVELGGEAGNTQYDDATGHILVAVQTRNDVAEIDPRTRTVVRRYALPGCLHGHGLAIDPANRYAYVACQFNSTVVRLNLRKGRVDATSFVGIGADVLAIDFGLYRLYIASESGVITIFDIQNSRFTKLAQSFFAPNAHVVAIHVRSHRAYFPIANVDGRPVLRIALPTFTENHP